MEDIHKKILQRNRYKIVTGFNPSNLYDGLVEKGVFTQDMIDDIKSAGTTRDQARRLVNNLEKRGSRAFPMFLECLSESGQQMLAELLQNEQAPFQPLPPLPIVCPVVQPRPLSPEIEYIKPPERPRSNSIQNYKMDASPCGHCLIINNVDFEPKSELHNRTGSNIDCDRLERRFKSFNFIVQIKTNLKSKQIKKEILALSKVDHSLYDCCVVILLSHGTEALFLAKGALKRIPDGSSSKEWKEDVVSHNRFPGAVHGVDGPAVPVQHITSSLIGNHCPSLQGKPKLFFIQACGGDEKDKGFEVTPDEGSPSIGGEDEETDAFPTSSSSDSLSMSDETDARATLPNPSDILVSYSTFPGYVSWRDPNMGSWYVETLNRVLEENAKIHDLATMLMIVNNEVSQNSAKGLYKQMPGSFNSLRKLLYFQTTTQISV